jgi:hypothetical protein
MKKKKNTLSLLFDNQMDTEKCSHRIGPSRKDRRVSVSMVGVADSDSLGLCIEFVGGSLPCFTLFPSLHKNQNKRKLRLLIWLSL